jgi:polysaccharide deacetylase family protein (PEP-CTERM system associated)
VDIEEWFCQHTEEAPELGGVEMWPTYEHRVHLILPRLLDYLAETGVKATFFVVGWYAERHPDVIRRIQQAGHAIGSHTYWHRSLFLLDENQLRDDLRHCKTILEDITGTEIDTFRAPNFSIYEHNLWALRVIAEEGFRYDSSIFPAPRFDGGIPGFPSCPVKIEIDGLSLYELPTSIVSFFGKDLPIFGGGYFRIVPDLFINAGIRQLGRENRPVVFYFHPFDFDHQAPVYVYKFVNRFRHCTNRKSLYGRVHRLLESHKWVAMDEYLSSLSYSSTPVEFKGLKVYKAIGDNLGLARSG